MIRRFPQRQVARRRRIAIASGGGGLALAVTGLVLVGAGIAKAVAAGFDLQVSLAIAEKKRPGLARALQRIDAGTAMSPTMIWPMPTPRT